MGIHEMRDPEALIDTLSHGMRPVRRVAPPWVRAMGWAPVALGAGFLSTRMLHLYATDWHAGHAVISFANAALCLTLGLVGLACSLSLGLADGRVRARGWILAGMVAWALLAATSIALSPRPFAFVPGVGSYCFGFVLTAGLPMVGVTIAALRRTRSLRPGQSLMAAGMAIAFLSFGLLAFCHPAEMSVADFVMHLLAALALGGLTVVLGRPAVRV
jgi:hypothetical protein